MGWYEMGFIRIQLITALFFLISSNSLLFSTQNFDKIVQKLNNCDFSTLNDVWNREGRFYDFAYDELHGHLFLNDLPYHFSLSKFDIEFTEDEVSRSRPDELPTSKRIVLEVSENPYEKPDSYWIIFNGWGETTAHIEGDFLKILLLSLKNKGYKNPKIIGINNMGRGTFEYMQNLDAVSNISLDLEFLDTIKILAKLQELGRIGEGEINYFGHSLGAMNAMAGSEIESIAAPKKLYLLMPATDKGLGFIRPRALWTVLDQVPKGLFQAFLSKKGSIDLGNRWNNKMGGNDVDEERAVPGSATRFLQYYLHLKRIFTNLNKRLLEAGSKVILVEAADDVIVPERFSEREEKYFLKNGINTEKYDFRSFEHVIPYDMNKYQELELINLFDKTL
ncbi:MAG: hypothetical protein ABIA04_10330 [Pseudomonadota bacterium]